MKNLLKIVVQSLIQYPICFIILLFIYLIRPIFLIRIGLLSSWRMGHLAHDLEIYRADRNFFKFKSFDFFSHTHLISNHFLKKKWEEKVKFISPKIGFPLIKINKIFSKLFKKFSAHEIRLHQLDVNNLVEKSEKNIFLTSSEVEKGWKILSSIVFRDNKRYFSYKWNPFKSIDKYLD